MIKVHDNIYVGQARVKHILSEDEYSFLCVSHAFHYKLLGWKNGIRYQNNPYYVRYLRDHLLSINWIDASAGFYNWGGSGVETFIMALDFIETELAEGRKVFIFCDQGMSRSPSVALLYLAKRLHVIPDTSFEEAREKFLLLYPMYNPGGIADFIRENWGEIK